MVFSCNRVGASDRLPAMPSMLYRTLLAFLALSPWLAKDAHAQMDRACSAGTLYLTIDTGWGREAERIAEILRRRGIKATLFVAHEPTHRGDRSLDPAWANFWRARATEGHVFASHTDRHWYFTSDPGAGLVRYVSRNGPGEEVLDQAAMCRELAAPMERLREVVPDAQILPLWRAPGGITTPNARRLAEACGLRHQAWSRNGFLGDELNSTKYSNSALRDRALRTIQDGEVLVMHWGVRSRQDPYVNILDDVLGGLQSRGFCFRPLPPEGRP